MFRGGAETGKHGFGAHRSEGRVCVGFSTNWERCVAGRNSLPDWPPRTAPSFGLVYTRSGARGGGPQ